MLEYASFAQLVQSAQVCPPRVAIVLGSGMGDVASHLTETVSVPYHCIPGMSATSVVGHTGVLTLGHWAGQRVLLFQGRLHFYEGQPWASVTQSVRTAHALGARILLATSAAGGIHSALVPGSLMALRDHLEWTRPFCWRLPAPAGLGSARVSPYSPRLLQYLRWAAQDVGLPLHVGIYANLTGPCYETPAEIRALSAWGADAVGMSTAREIQTGFDLGMECAAVALITNHAAGISPGKLDHRDVLDVAQAAGGQLVQLLEKVLERLPLIEQRVTSLPHIPPETT